METLNNQQFEKLLNEARVEWFGDEILLSSDKEDEFYFYFSPSEEAIVTKGGIDLSEEQEEKLIAACVEFQDENPIEEEIKAFSNVSDPYSEYGVNRGMFI